MAESNRTAVSVVAILAIVILVGLIAYFVREETEDDIEIDLGQVEQEAPAPVTGFLDGMIVPGLSIHA